MLNYDCIIKEDHLDIRKLSENVKIPLSKEDEKIILDMHEYLVNGYDELVGYLKEVTDEGINLEINLKGRIKVVYIPFKIIEKAHLTYKI